MSSSVAVPVARRSNWLYLLDMLSTPALALVTAFVLGGLIIWVTSGNPATIFAAYSGMANGAFFKTRGFSETLIASVPYVLASLAVGLGFKAGLFNIGVEGQFYIGAVCAAWIGSAITGVPAVIHLPLTMLIAALGGAVWATIPGYLKARTGAHEVISTIMMNYTAFRLAEYLVSFPLRDHSASAVQTPIVAPEARLWTFYEIPQRLNNPLNALGMAIVVMLLGLLLGRWLAGRRQWLGRFASPTQRRGGILGLGIGLGVISYFALPALTRLWWPFTDQYDRLHLGIVLALAVAVAVWWLLDRTTLGFEMRTVGANPSAARYAGINIARNIVLTMALSGSLAGLAGSVEVLGLEHNLPIFFSSGYGFDSIAIALLAKNDPFGILAASFLWGAMRNGADLMELNSGVSKNVVALIQALVLLFVAAPAIVRWLYRLRVERRLEEEAPLVRGWGG
jgi:ABC-type uncharacterized transport system permease subunit